MCYLAALKEKPREQLYNIILLLKHFGWSIVLGELLQQWKSVLSAKKNIQGPEQRDLSL